MQIKKILSIILTVSIMATSFPLIVQAKEQTEEEIVSQVVEELEEIENKMQTAPKPTAITEHFEIDSKDKFIQFMTTPRYHESNWEINLQCDIDMGGAALSPIGHYFGTFNGNGHVVSNISLSCFVIDNQGTISGIGFRNEQQFGVAYDDIIAGFVIQNSRNGIINNCFIEMGNDIANETASYAAGFVSVNYGQITGCTAKVEVRGNEYVGGFVGYNSGTITNSTAEGKITGNNDVAGFVGLNESGTITNCTAGGEVIGNNGVPGFVGFNIND